VFAELLVIEADVADGVVVRVEIKTVLHDKGHKIGVSKQTLSLIRNDVHSLQGCWRFGVLFFMSEQYEGLRA